MYELLASCVHTHLLVQMNEGQVHTALGCVCVCVCVCVRVSQCKDWESLRVCMHMGVYVCMSKCAHVWACCLCVYTCECTYVSKYVHECECVHVWGCVWACVYTYADVMLSRWPCLLRQLSCYISLCALFAEPRVGKVETGKLEENSKSHRNCRHVYFLWAGKAAVAADITWPLIT